MAAKMAAVVIQPRTFMARVFTQRPMIFLLLVISITKSSRKGVEQPCTIPAQTKAFIGLNPKKFKHIASAVKMVMAT